MTLTEEELPPATPRRRLLAVGLVGGLLAAVAFVGLVVVPSAGAAGSCGGG